MELYKVFKGCLLVDGDYGRVICAGGKEGGWVLSVFDEKGLDVLFFSTLEQD
ncbi:hypothetical protein [Xenorhabdus bovienii]|uniref:hypothetical protein n=1 Tax=Xenorhabdus bovienii TaxID=40576 RepID=UPI0012D2F996|nr:hypothetical protein [Xenorhabdus bovienii]